jgi:hypothetical protein
MEIENKQEDKQTKESYLPSIIKNSGKLNPSEFQDLEILASQFGLMTNFTIERKMDQNLVYGYIGNKKEYGGTEIEYRRYEKLKKKNSTKRRKESEKDLEEAKRKAEINKAGRFFRESYKNGE